MTLHSLWSYYTENHTEIFVTLKRYGNNTENINKGDHNDNPG